jgi:Phage protein (N4 Gp49/phage Sf6 gene 66) family
MMTDEELKAALESLPGERVTEDYIESRIVGRKFDKMGLTVTVCSLLLDNGYSVRGESACVDPANYNKEIGEKLAFDDAFRKLWPLFGFLLAEARHRRKAQDPGRLVPRHGSGP